MSRWAVAVILLIIAHLQAASSSCPGVCLCPREPPRCAVGVSLVSDGCGCCKVCARQLNEDCSRAEPCDHAKGLECNTGSVGGATGGICRAASEGRPCEYSSRIYQNGESFQPNCKHQCTCLDGAVGCVPLCPQELSLPSLGCATPRLVKVPGRCCEEWLCEGGNKGGAKPVLDQSETELTSRNELISEALPAFRPGPEKCLVQTTPWSSCSKTCGTGISSRITNHNAACRLTEETRLCEVRPCSQAPPTSLKKGKRCQRIIRSARAVPFSYAGCSSVRKYRPRHCGSCRDGRCCRPLLTRTLRVHFRCPDGDAFAKNVMMTQSCSCSRRCSRASHAPFYRLVNDIHRFRD